MRGVRKSMWHASDKSNSHAGNNKKKSKQKLKKKYRENNTRKGSNNTSIDMISKFDGALWEIEIVEPMKLLKKLLSNNNLS